MMHYGAIIETDWLFDYNNLFHFTIVMASTLASYSVNHLDIG